MWGQRRSWSNGDGYTASGYNGTGWVVTQGPYIRQASGNDHLVVILDGNDARDFVHRTVDFLQASLPRYAREGKAYLTVAIGCTGGRHRSVAVVEELARGLSDWRVTVRHRDLERRETTP